MYRPRREVKIQLVNGRWGIPTEKIHSHLIQICRFGTSASENARACQDGHAFFLRSLPGLASSDGFHDPKCPLVSELPLNALS